MEERDLSAWSAVSTAESAVTTVEAFACDETPELRPLTEQLAQRMCQQRRGFTAVSFLFLDYTQDKWFN